MKVTANIELEITLERGAAVARATAPARDWSNARRTGQRIIWAIGFGEDAKAQLANLAAKLGVDPKEIKA